DKVLKTLLNEEYIENFKTCQRIIDSIEMPTDDQIKRGKYTSELKEAAEKFLNK
ncbi:hypothetical protein SEEH1576_07598, partial [Salmonella enterica subsp. enterica serovar Heidelberg str. 41576]